MQEQYVNPTATSDRLRWHWLWFLPVCLLVLFLVETHTVGFAFAALKLALDRWTWGLLISPSAAFCGAVLVASILAPLQGLFLLGGVVKERTVKTSQRVLYVFVGIVAILFLPMVTDILIWGSFPLSYDNQGFERLRMIPFLPWPKGKCCWDIELG